MHAMARDYDDVRQLDTLAVGHGDGRISSWKLAESVPRSGVGSLKRSAANVAKREVA
jgi:hypothetical protein